MGVTRVMGLTALTGVRGVTGACKVEKGPVKDKQVENGKKVRYSDRPETTKKAKSFRQLYDAI